MLWSFSKLINYERCPHTQSFKPTYGGSKETNPFAERGKKIHEECANYLRGFPNGTITPELFNVNKFDFPTLGENQPVVEQRLYLNEKWEETGRDNAFLVIIPDAYFIRQDGITIIDFKTGKREYKEIKHSQQMQLYASALDAINPGKLFINCDLWYLDQGFTHHSVQKPSRLSGIRMRLHNRALTMLDDTKLTPKPSKQNCRFCDFKQQCDYAWED